MDTRYVRIDLFSRNDLHATMHCSLEGCPHVTNMLTEVGRGASSIA